MTVGFGLQIVECTIRELEFTFLCRVRCRTHTPSNFDTYLLPASLLEYRFLLKETANT